MPDESTLSHVELTIRYCTDLALAVALFIGFSYCSKFVRYIPTILDSPTWLVNMLGVASLVIISFTSLWLVAFVANETARFVLEWKRRQN